MGHTNALDGQAGRKVVARGVRCVVKYRTTLHIGYIKAPVSSLQDELALWPEA